MIYWFTGQPGHGKTTLALALIAQLKRLGYAPHHIDGDKLRDITANKEYCKDGRTSNIKNAQNIARYLHAKNEVVSLIAPYKDLREEFKSSIEVTEIYVHTTEIRGREENHAKDYEAPESDFIDLDTGTLEVEECILTILEESPVPSKELKTLDKRKTLAVDFDGVIHKYSRGFQGLDNAYDPPMEGAMEVLQRLKDSGYVLKIMSSRPALVIEEWLEKYEMTHLFEAVSNSKFAATIYLDDRGFHFTNWEIVEAQLAKHPKFAQ
jgi:adenylylsulfate kinase-like enzyme